jgi:hypothetical protein
MKRWRKDGHGCLLADQKCLSTPQSAPRQTWRRFRSWRSRASANRSGAADYIAGRKQDFQWDRIREGFAHHADQRKSLTRCCLGRERHQSVKVGTRHHGLHRTGGAVGRSAIPSPILGGDTPPDASIVEAAAVRAIAPRRIMNRRRVHSPWLATFLPAIPRARPRSGRLAMMPRGLPRGGQAKGECSLGNCIFWGDWIREGLVHDDKPQL